MLNFIYLLLCFLHKENKIYIVTQELLFLSSLFNFFQIHQENMEDLQKIEIQIIVTSHFEKKNLVHSRVNQCNLYFPKKMCYLFVFWL